MHAGVYRHGRGHEWTHNNGVIAFTCVSGSRGIKYACDHLGYSCTNTCKLPLRLKVAMGKACPANACVCDVISGA